MNSQHASECLLFAALASPKTNDDPLLLGRRCAAVNSLTNKGRAVVKEGGTAVAEYEAFHFHCRNFVWLVCALGLSQANAQVNVTQEHNNPSRDGVYIDAAFTPSAAANLMRDLSFNGTISGNVYAQPLYIEGGPNGPMIIAVTESNNVYALNATTGTVIWQRTDIGPSVTSGLPCSNINPVWYHWHARCRSHFPKAFLRRIDRWHNQKTFHLFVRCGHRGHNSGWPVDVNATATYNGMNFVS